ncbi:MAG: tRNA (adenosine(37)-N6)-threonylcarbamoyltransferase complex dimerization subunit type 1 TsaB [Pseudomonadota bacterium]
MLVMGLDTALQRCSVAIIRGDQVLVDESVGMERGHAEHLAPMAAAALTKAGVAIHQLDRIGVVVGPGGFTGVRVGLSFARGLGVGTDIPLVGITSLAALAAGVAAPGITAPIIDARRGQVYAGLYNVRGDTLLQPFVANPKACLKILLEKAAGSPVTLVGSGAPLLGDVPAGWRIDDRTGEIDAKTVACLAASAPPPEGAPAPLYLRAPDAKPGKPGVFAGVKTS